MATDKDFVAYVAEQSQLGAALIFKKLFGEYGVYLDGKVIAFACDNSLFVKPSDTTAETTRSLPQRPPYPGAKPYPVADELLDDSDALKMLLVQTALGLPAPKPGRSRAASKRRGMR